MVVEYGQTEMDITVCVTEVGAGAHTPGAGPIRGTDMTHTITSTNMYTEFNSR